MDLFLPLLCVILAMGLISHAQNDQQEFLNLHNTVRAQVGVGPLVWNHTLATFAQGFANEVKQKCDNTNQSGGPYGENTASGYGAFSTAEAVGQWAVERSNYDHYSNKCLNGTECRHYTQVAWKNSMYLGCASIFCGAGWPFVVCEYYPKGNIPGQWPY